MVYEIRLFLEYGYGTWDLNGESRMDMCGDIGTGRRQGNARRVYMSKLNVEYTDFDLKDSLV